MKLKFQEIADSYKMLHSFEEKHEKNNDEVTLNNRNKTSEGNYISNTVTNPISEVSNSEAKMKKYFLSFCLLNSNNYQNVQIEKAYLRRY